MDAAATTMWARRWCPRFGRMKLPLNEDEVYPENGLHAYASVQLVEEEVTDSAIRRLLFDAGDDIDDLMTSVKPTSRKCGRWGGTCKLQDCPQEADRSKRKIAWNFQLSTATRSWRFSDWALDGRWGLKSAIKEAILDGEIPNNGRLPMTSDPKAMNWADMMEK